MNKNRLFIDPHTGVLLRDNDAGLHLARLSASTGSPSAAVIFSACQQRITNILVCHAQGKRLS